MAYERNTSEGIRSWLVTEISSTGWNASSIAKGLTEDVMTLIAHNFKEFESRVKQALLLSILFLRKSDIILLNHDIRKIVQDAYNDQDEFIKTMAHVLETYALNQQLNTKIDSWSEGFNVVLKTIGSEISEKGIQFHSLEDSVLQLNARMAPLHVTSGYLEFKPTQVRHFRLTQKEGDIESAEARHACFKNLVESEERSEQAEAQAAQVVAQKRAGAELTHKVKRPLLSPTQPTTPVRPLPAAPSLFTKRPARPQPSGLFIRQQKPTPIQKTPIQRTTLNANNLPRGLQRVQKTQMLDFNAATEFEQSHANAIKQVQDEIKAKQEAKKQELAERRQKLADEKLKREEAKRAQEEAKRAQKLAAEKEKQLAKEALAAEKAAVPDPSSSPKTPTSPLSPQLKYDHVFAIPSLPAKHAQKEKRAEKLNTF